MTGSTSRPRSSLEDFRLDTRTYLFGEVIRLRLVFSPALAALALTVMILDPAVWRRVALGALVVSLLVVSVIELRRFRRHGMRAAAVPFNILFVAVAQLTFVFCTGGVMSPLMPVVIIFTFGAAIFGATPLPGLVAIFLQIPAIWVMAVLHANGTVPDMVPGLLQGLAGDGSGYGLWIAAALYSIMLLVVPRLGNRMRLAVEDVHARAVAERERSLHLYAERNRELTMLSGEIAHELKNPLASVKGLSALVAKDVDGRAAERTEVLRREVDRMQTILEEFLNFSRPLVPLDQEEVDLRALAADVLALHEGLARDRGVSLELAATASTTVRCDPRKVRQVLANLIHNALDEARETVRVEIETGRQARPAQGASDGDRADARGAESMVIRVIDDGAGIPAEVAERLFEPGVTTKEHGSGLGLTVARALARQHGGELELSGDAERGCVATVTLPRAGAREPVQAEAPA